jgi:hypothetical protein
LETPAEKLARTEAAEGALLRMKTRKGLLLLVGMTMLILASTTAMAADPGTPFDPLQQASDQKAGSILFYNIYTSSVSAPALQNTKMSMTNTSSSNGIAVHLFFVDGAACSVADRYICLTANQTTVLLASEQDPGTSGYLLAVATDFDGLPALHNFLIGDEYVKFDTGHFASLGADAYAKINDTNVVSTDGSLAALFFDGLNLAGSYNTAPRVVAIDNIGAPASGNDTLLILNRIGGNLTTTAGSLGPMFGLLFDDAEQPHSFNFNGGCHFRLRLSDAFPRTAPRLSQVIPAGQSGWMKVFGVADVALSGVVITASTAPGAGSFSGGHSLHALRLSASGVYTMPVFAPGC